MKDLKFEANLAYQHDAIAAITDHSAVAEIEGGWFVKTHSGTAAKMGCVKREKVAFLSSRRMPPAAVMASLDWAATMRAARSTDCSQCFRICPIASSPTCAFREILGLTLNLTIRETAYDHLPPQ